MIDSQEMTPLEAHALTVNIEILEKRNDQRRLDG
jgi:hypothetical protein